MMSESSTGKLYIVATPIGNLEDITLRALKVLKSVSLIAAEDTRRTQTLLRTYDISTPVTSLYDQIEAKKSEVLIGKMEKGMDIAYVSDAGTPGISDPGYILINEAIKKGITIVPIPGASAAITALCASGPPMHAFVFQAFLPAKKSQRRETLKTLAAETRTLIFYESPNRILATLHDILEIFGTRHIVIARELTKVFEEIIRGDLLDIMETLKTRTIKGEITLIIAGRENVSPNYSDSDIQSRLEALAGSHDFTTRELDDHVASEMDLPRRRVYQIALKALVNNR
ncbi:MAG: 16S rRNA (cytidine(1402)-2'-O)-methyltransferase [Syntrophales bacterium]|nr:16S rRNA (cytidine(1402)-2'-O)-methyltransferase [Syntrophales bacterium]